MHNHPIEQSIVMDSSQFMKKSQQGYLGHVENVSIQNNWILPNWSVVNLPYERAAIVESNFIKTKMVNLPKWGLRPKWFRFLSTTKSNSAMFYISYVLNAFFGVICHIFSPKSTIPSGIYCLLLIPDEHGVSVRRR